MDISLSMRSTSPNRLNTNVLKLLCFIRTLNVKCRPSGLKAAVDRYAMPGVLRKRLQLVVPLFFLSTFSACYPGVAEQRSQQQNNPVQFGLYFSQDMPQEDCRLIERYYSEERERREYPGVLNRDEFSCTVVLPIEQFEQEFDFCYLAGISQEETDGSRTIECFIQKRSEDYQIKAAISFPSGKSSLLACNFTCISLNRAQSD